MKRCVLRRAFIARPIFKIRCDLLQTCTSSWSMQITRLVFLTQMKSHVMHSCPLLDFRCGWRDGVEVEVDHMRACRGQCPFQCLDRVRCCNVECFFSNRKTLHYQESSRATLLFISASVAFFQFSKIEAIVGVCAGTVVRPATLQNLSAHDRQRFSESAG